MAPPGHVCYCPLITRALLGIAQRYVCYYQIQLGLAIFDTTARCGHLRYGLLPAHTWWPMAPPTRSPGVSLLQPILTWAGCWDMTGGKHVSKPLTMAAHSTTHRRVCYRLALRDAHQGTNPGHRQSTHETVCHDSPMGCLTQLSTIMGLAAQHYPVYDIGNSK